MIASTSRQAYYEFKAEGKLSARAQEVLAALRVAKRPVTGREIAEYKGIDGAWKRLPELERSLLAVRCGTRRCSITKCNATSWRAVT